MKKSNIFKMFSTIALGAAPFVGISCQSTAEQKEETIEIRMPQDAMSYSDKVAQEAMEKAFNDKLMASKHNFKIKFVAASDNDLTTLNDVSSNDNIVAFPAVSKFYLDKDLYLKTTNVFMRTLTNAFKNNLSSEGYSKGENNYLIEQAKNQNEIFQSRGGYANWAKTDYVNYIYPWCYESNKTVGWQRGAIWIMGTPEERQKIKEAWNTGNYEEFRKHGIIIGNENSGSKYLLPQALLKKQFSAYFADKSLKTETATPETASYYTSSLKAKAMGSQNTYKIAFDNEMAFAYTESKKDNYKVNETVNPNASLEILTITDAIPYNIGVASKNIKYDKLNAIVTIFKELAQENNNPIGVAGGFNDYEVVTNVQEQIIKMCENAGI
ncbi:ABC transporter thiamine pyrophosphate-binding lipoprotein p37/Cypl [Mycoplasmopsis felifaucium]|uniref:High affinity transport system protein p37 n=1 Tax=Mycoplasmopsis felifaucium TaxID=35768 RepID=A0ABZ2RQH2_9BACT